MVEFVTILTGVFQFWDEVTYFVKLLKKTPAEKHAELLSDLGKAFDKAAATGDTSDIEKLL